MAHLALRCSALRCSVARCVVLVQVYECRGHSWVSEWQESVVDGVPCRYPCYTMSVINTGDTVCVSN